MKIHSAHCDGACGKNGMSSNPDDYCALARRFLGSDEQIGPEMAALRKLVEAHTRYRAAKRELNRLPTPTRRVSNVKTTWTH
jgi:hypothetical protein